VVPAGDFGQDTVSMNDRVRVRIAWAAGALVAMVSLANAVLHVLNGPRGWQHEWGFPGAGVVSGLVLAAAGTVVAARRPRNPVGWIFLGAGASLATAYAAQQYSIHTNFVSPGSLPGGLIAAWLGGSANVPLIPLLVVFLPLLFPDGHLPSARWRIPARILVLTSIAYVVLAAIPATLTVGPDGTAAGQASDLSRGPASDAVSLLTFFTLFAGLASIATLIVRYRRALGEEREQLKWFLYAGAVMVAGFALIILDSTLHGPVLDLIAPPLAVLAILAVPAATGVAILRYRLYDIDVVINRTLVYGALAAFITAVYVGIVVGVGTLVGSGGQPNIVLSIIATAIVAVAFQPVRERLQKVANRVVYGNRATPYEVLSQFSERVAETYAADEALPRMARVLGEGTGADRAEVWLRRDGTLLPAAAWQVAVDSGGPGADAIALNGQDLPEMPGADRAVAVRHQGDLLGALTVTKRRGESLTPVEEKLLADLASQAGLVLKNVGLTAELLQRLEELRASRHRLVAAQDEERRRLERNLHDGAQQNLVALKVKLGLAEMLADKDADKTRQLLAELKDDTDETLDTLRDLARGIYPPLLADRGLAVALEAQARKATLPVEVIAVGIERYPQEVEAAVYFCALEALQNVQKYAAASSATVRLSGRDGSVAFDVEDDGKGFDPATTVRGAGMTNMADRLNALGGGIEVESKPGSGVRLRGTIPVP
jgi:signal transduction histidine kinase